MDEHTAQHHIIGVVNDDMYVAFLFTLANNLSLGSSNWGHSELFWDSFLYRNAVTNSKKTSAHTYLGSSRLQ